MVPRTREISRRAALGGAAAAGLSLPAINRARAADQRLVLYSANEDTVNGMLTNAFAKATGIKIDVVSAGSGVLFRRLEAERKRPQADALWGVSSAQLVLHKDLFEPYAAKERDEVPAAYRDPENYWLGTNLQILTINQNTKAIPADQGPRSWSDLLDPKWKHKIGYTNPANSGSSYETATLLLSLWGNDKAAWQKLTKLIANTVVVSRSTLVFNGNGTGEFPLGISLEYAGFLWAHNGSPLKVVYPSDGTMADAEGVAVIKGARDTGNAHKLVDFLNTKKMQEEYLRTTFRRPARQDVDVTVVHGMPPLAKIKLLPWDAKEWNTRRAKVLNHLRTVIQNTR